jgi:hypothetical protein
VIPDPLHVPLLVDLLELMTVTSRPRPARPARLGGAGASARDMSSALRRDGRRLRLIVYGVVLLVLFFGVWLLLGSLQLAVGAAVMAAGAIAFAAARRNDDAAKWARGAAGEKRTARYLRPLERRGHVVLHDRGLGRVTDTANIDHLVIGPHGVIVVDSKNWSKHTLIKFRRGRVYVGRTGGAKVIAGTAVERRRVAQVLSAELGRPVDAAAVLAVHGAKIPYWRRPEIEGIPLLRARAVRRWITRRPVVYDQATVARLAAAADRTFPPYEQH